MAVWLMANNNNNNKIHKAIELFEDFFFSRTQNNNLKKSVNSPRRARWGTDERLFAKPVRR